MLNGKLKSAALCSSGGETSGPRPEQSTTWLGDDVCHHGRFHDAKNDRRGGDRDHLGDDARIARRGDRDHCHRDYLGHDGRSTRRSYRYFRCVSRPKAITAFTMTVHSCGVTFMAASMPPRSTSRVIGTFQICRMVFINLQRGPARAGHSNT